MKRALINLLWGDPEAAPADRVQLAAHAERLLGNHVLALAFDRLERDLLNTIRNSAVGACEEREEAYRLIWALGGIKTKLQAMLGDGKIIAALQKDREAEEARAAQRRERYA